MGKKDKKKGKGVEKTIAKTEKKLAQKMKKKLAIAGEVSCVYFSSFLLHQSFISVCFAQLEILILPTLNLKNFNYRMTLKT